MCASPEDAKDVVHKTTIADRRAFEAVREGDSTYGEAAVRAGWRGQA